MTDPRPFTVGVVACGSAKVNYRAPARHLYVANLFVQTLQAAEAQGFDQVVILSARHGLVDPDTPLTPYNVTMGAPSAITAALLADQVGERFAHHPKVDVWFFLPSKYLALADEAFRSHGIVGEHVYKGCDSIGAQRRVNRWVTHRGINRLGDLPGGPAVRQRLR